jgi:hypothetical protein
MYINNINNYINILTFNIYSNQNVLQIEIVNLLRSRLNNM